MFRSLLPKLSEPPTPPNEFELDFRVIERIGGRVYKAIHDSGKFIVVKKIPIPEDGSKENQIKMLEDEVRNLQSLSHPNIVQYLGTRRAEGTLFILMEFWGTSLFNKFAVLLNETRTRRYTIQLLQGLKYLHERKTVHGNIKGANIQVDASGDIKLADFGLSAHSNLVGNQSSSAYRHAIEIFQPPPHLDLSADIWCVGCTMIELTSGKDPWSRESWSNYLLPKKFSFHAKDFLQDCLQWEQQEDSRLATFVLLQHPFLNPTFDVRPTQLLPRESLVAEVLHSSSPSPNYAAAAAARLILDHHYGISGVEAAADEPSPITVEPPIMQSRPNQAFGLQHGTAGAVPFSLTLSSNIGSTSGTNYTESISSSFGSGVTSVSEPSSRPLNFSSTSCSSCLDSKSSTSESKSISTLVHTLDPNTSTCFQKEVYVRKRRFVFLKFICFWSP
uniref:mitogen-activated protein kinase kinase kinase NPK1-like n=1 Tax=Fragaria vesca subsp. vesca TaxID=101020 RepID=UPI0005CA8DAD|nr:PREDICTED: mitogen-activated protein kinase kinase kinase NPK1-like [Fragaria vesca subsp. vesca]